MPNYLIRFPFQDFQSFNELFSFIQESYIMTLYSQRKNQVNKSKNLQYTMVPNEHNHIHVVS